MNTEKEALEWVAGFYAMELIANIRGTMAIAGYTEKEADNVTELAGRYIANRQNRSCMESMRNAYAGAVEKGLL